MNSLLSLINAADRAAISETNFERIDGSLAFMQQPGIDAATGLPTVNYGAPASGTFVIGKLFVDAGLAVWRCNAAGTPGTWIQIAPATVAIAPVVTVDNYLIEIPAQNWARFYWSVAATAWKPVNLQP